jgi:hypothetical protein
VLTITFRGTGDAVLRCGDVGDDAASFSCNHTHGGHTCGADSDNDSDRTCRDVDDWTTVDEYIGDGALYSGHVRVYQLDDSDQLNKVWAKVGQDINGEASYDYSGYSVSMSREGKRVAIGAYGNGDGADYSGHVRVYELDDSDPPKKGWVKVGQDIDGKARYDYSGRSVSMSGKGQRVAIGAYGSGRVRVYELDGSNQVWVQIGLDIDSEARYDYSGYSVSMSEDGARVAIGAYGNDGNDRKDVNYGHVRVYDFDPLDLAWVQIGQDIDGEARHDSSGYSVSLSDDGARVAIGAIYNDGNGQNSGHMRVYVLKCSKP